MPEQPRLEELAHDDCVTLLRSATIGRIAVVLDGAPIILPVNYRLVETSGRAWIAVRTRPGNVIDRAGLHAAFEIDGIDPGHHEGWSVLVRGTLHHVDDDAADFRERFDPEPWMSTERDAWLIVDPFAITGRRLHAAEAEWPFEPRGYL
jgi:nitroimidazol reductase NimA-like FMN-containing flavoprotein (pyridoxamine 5'-phosphate oxidase superfamily)